MKAKDAKEYNLRKLQVLRFANNRKHPAKGITPKELAFNLKLNYFLAKQLLYKYGKADLFSHPRRGVYRLNKHGKNRLLYLEIRQQISKVTEIDIGLNHHRPLPIPFMELAQKYQAATGQPIPAIRL